MTTKWTASSIPDLTSKVAIVTGANSGIGYETARALARKGASVVLACRNNEKGEAAAQSVRDEFTHAQAEHIQLDLSALASVRSFAKRFISHYDRLDMLINNAGIMMTPFGRTADGFELQFGTNHLGHFALTGRLLELIMQTPNGRVVTVSSVAHRFGRIDFGNLNGEREYSRRGAYRLSKLANLLFTYELQRRFESAGADNIAVAAHPGWSATNLQAHVWYGRMMNPFVGQRPEMGALPTLDAATAPDVKGGDYFGPRGWLKLRGHPTKVQSSERSHEIELAAKLWTVSEELTGERYARLADQH